LQESSCIGSSHAQQSAGLGVDHFALPQALP
jgi:hypothetical protein